MPRLNEFKYPWKRWFSKRSFVVVKGKHFDGMPHAMSQQIRNAARKRGLRVSIHIDGGILSVENLGRVKHGKV